MHLFVRKAISLRQMILLNGERVRGCAVTIVGSIVDESENGTFECIMALSSFAVVLFVLMHGPHSWVNTADMRCRSKRETSEPYWHFVWAGWRFGIRNKCCFRHIGCLSVSSLVVSITATKHDQSLAT